MECSMASQNAGLFALMKDVYLWYEHVPDVDPSAYESPNELLGALVYKKFDAWSYISTKAADDTYYKEGVRVGLGLRIRRDRDDVIRIGLVYPGSPAAAAGLSRGDTVLMINGKTTAEIDALDLWNDIFGEDNVIEQLMTLGGWVPVQLPMLVFAIFTSLLQAFIFTTLSTVLG